LEEAGSGSWDIAPSQGRRKKARGRIALKRLRRKKKDVRSIKVGVRYSRERILRIKGVQGMSIAEEILENCADNYAWVPLSEIERAVGGWAGYGDTL